MKKSLRVLAGLMVICMLATVSAFALSLEYPTSPQAPYTKGVKCVVDWMTEVRAGKKTWQIGSHSATNDTRTYVTQSEPIWNVDTDDVAYLSMENKHDGTGQTSFRNSISLDGFDFTEAIAKDGYLQLTYKVDGDLPNNIDFVLQSQANNWATYNLSLFDKNKLGNGWVTVKRKLSDFGWGSIDKTAVTSINFEFQAAGKGSEEEYNATFAIKELAVYVPDDLQVKSAMYDCTEIFANNGWQWSAGSDDNGASSYTRDAAEADKPKRFTLTWQPTGTSSKGRRIKFEKAGGGDSVPWDFTEGKNIGYLRITFKLDAPTDWFVLQWLNSSFQKIEEQQLQSYVVPNRWVQMDIPLSSLAQTNDVAYLEIRYKNKQTSEYENRATVMELADLGIYFPAPKFELSNFKIQKDGVDTTTYAAGDTLTVAGDIYNSATQKDFKVITALYDGTTLKTASITPVSAAAYSGSTSLENVSFTVPQAGGEGTEIKVFVFDDLEDIIPIVENVPVATKAQS